jgi:hypothetical protein
MSTDELPATPEEWQDLVDSCDGAIAFDSAKQYGLVAGGPEINVERCQELLTIAAERGYHPRIDAPERFVAMLLIDQETA